MARSSKDLEELQNNFLLYLAACESWTELDDNIFLNNLTLRLTKHGCAVFKHHFQYWDFASPGMSAGNVLSLMRKMTYPYYIDKNHIVLFTESDAFICKLAGVENWMDHKRQE